MPCRDARDRLLLRDLALVGLQLERLLGHLGEVDLTLLQRPAEVRECAAL